MKLTSIHYGYGKQHVAELDRTDIGLFVDFLVLFLKLGVPVRCDLAAYLMKNNIPRVQWKGVEDLNGNMVDSVYEFFPMFGPALHEWRPKRG